ncbi:MAG: EAL domain-containing protein [Methyloprofundus sp.]|nr:EAL domain-containing protein [Methyloprofundus sp.]
MANKNSTNSIFLHFLLQEHEEHVIHVDAGVMQLLGYSAEKFLNAKLGFPELIHTDDQDIIIELFSLKPQLQLKAINFRCRKANGKVICLQGSYQKLTDKASKGLRLQLQLTDAKALKQAVNDQILLANFTAMMENTDDYIYFKDRNHVFTGASQTLVALTSPSEHWTDLLGKTDYDVFPEILADAYYRLEKHIFSAQTKIAHELQQTLDNDGHPGWIDNRKYPIKDKAGNVIGLFGVARDITASKLLERVLEQSEKRYRTIFNDAPLGIAVIDSLTGQIYEVNPSYEKTVGRSEEELKTINWMKITHPDDVQEDLDNLALMNSGKTSGFAMNKRYIQPDGTIVWINMTIAPLAVEDTSKPHHLCMIEDITKRKAAETKLKLAETVYQNTTQAITVTDADSLVVAVNPAFTDLTGYSSADVLGKPHKIFSSAPSSASLYAKMWKSIDATGQWQGEFWNKKKDGTEYAESLTINSIYDEKGNLSQRVALFSDITNKKLADEKIWKQANFDALTNLPNRHLFGDRLAHEIKAAQRTKKSLALFFIDLDHFKEVNDTFGHDKGDLLLVEAAQRIQRCVRESDTISRLGGDEFTVILTELESPLRVERIAEGLLHSLSLPFALGLEEVYISASLGIAFYPDDTDNTSELVRNADQAMYIAKENGRNQFSFFTQSMQVTAQYRHLLLKDLRHALSEGQFLLYFQPIINLDTGNVTKAEALLRWNHPTRGMLSPAEFIPLAEESGLIVDIGDWVFQQAVQQLKHWQPRIAADFQISINKSSVQFQAQEGNNDWLTYLKKHTVSSHNLVIEITESLLVDDSEQVKKQLLYFRDNNIQVALDDFGTGYSALVQLNKFDIDYLKIDRTFIENLSKESSELMLCEAIIVMAHKLGLKVIAEGIETTEQLQILTNAGCDYGQGFLFSKPVPAAEFEQLLPRNFL